MDPSLARRAVLTGVSVAADTAGERWIDEYVDGDPVAPARAKARALGVSGYAQIKRQLRAAAIETIAGIAAAGGDPLFR